MNCIETQDLTHAFTKEAKVLHHLSIRVPHGSIYGFLGPNGAGKTTTLRLLLGLLRRQRGSISIFNRSFDTHRIQILRKIGSLIESPSLYGHLTALENLRVWQKLYQCSTTRFSEVLNLVGLSGTAQKKVSQYSLGMKQRLSIAVSLLHEPALLILDEPTNGLDPQGIIDIREMLKRLNQQRETTIVISSHLLAEIGKLVTHVGIIHQGRMLFEGSLDELHSKQASEATLQFDTSDPQRAAGIILSHGFESSLSNRTLHLPVMDKHTIARLNASLVESGIEVYQIQQVQGDLESIFINLVSAN